jgi:hypothetical protein
VFEYKRWSMENQHIPVKENPYLLAHRDNVIPFDVGQGALKGRRVRNKGSNRVAWAVGPSVLGLLLEGRSDAGRLVGFRVRNEVGGLLLLGGLEEGRYLGVGVWDELDGPLGAHNLYAVRLVDGELAC